MSELPWVRFFPSDWLAGTRGLSATETGIYISLVAMMYERGEPLAEEHERLRRLCGATTSQFEKALAKLIQQGKLLRVTGGLWNRRVDQERTVQIKRALLSKQAAKIRWQKEKQIQMPHHASAMHPQSNGNAIQISKKNTTATSEQGAARASHKPNRRQRLSASLRRMGHEVREEELSVSSSPPNGREESVT